MINTRSQLEDAARGVRDRTIARVVSDYEDVADRLEDAYNDVLTSMEGAFSQLPDLAGADMTEDEIRLALEGWKLEIERELAVMQGTITELAGEIEQTGIVGGYQVGLANLGAGGMNVTYSQTTLTIIQQGINIVDSQPFRDMVAGYAQYHAEQVRNIVIAELARGENPRVAARLAQQYFRERANPQADALRLFRTTQMYVLRQSTALTYQQNGVTEWVWLANLGNTRTCMGCIAMHGTRHPVTEILNDHHNGRCVMMPVTPTWAELGLAGGTDFGSGLQTGPEWFENQAAEVQRAIMGPQLFEQYQQGLIPFTPETIVTTYEHPVWGVMRRPMTNEAIFEMLGIGQ